MAGEEERFHFALLVHSRDIIEQFREIMADSPDEMRYELVNLENAPGRARSCLDSGREVILCHGGTGNMILRSLPGSVVMIERTDMDVLKTLRLAKRHSQDIILATHPDEFHDMEEMERLLEIRIHHLSYDSPARLRAEIRRFHSLGIRTIVGGGISKSYMEELGGVGFVIEPSRHNILMALTRARNMARRQREEKRRASSVMRLFESLPIGVICIDAKEHLLLANGHARKLLHLSSSGHENVFRRFFQPLGLTDVLQNSSTVRDKLTEVHGGLFVVTTFALSLYQDTVYAVSIFHDASEMRRIGQKIDMALASRGFAARTTLDDIRGSSPPAILLKKKIRRYAATKANVLIHGETGSGKELVAHALHVEGAGGSKPFVAVNLAAVSPHLLESELFGYAEGAFTGARRGGKMGLFELANMGTLFLDEIGDISEEMQVRLLRVLESREIMRVGGSRMQPINVRIVSASNKPLQGLVKKGKFRMDLYYRLATLTIQVPPLRERLDDIPSILEELTTRLGRKPSDISPAMTEAMKGHRWPGNIRELLAVIERYFLLLEGDGPDPDLFASLMDENMRFGMEAHLGNGACDVTCPPEQCSEEMPKGVQPANMALSFKESMNLTKSRLLHEALGRAHGDKKRAARLLNVSYSTLWRMLREEADVAGRSTRRRQEA